jgi:predicted PurR-regulated permease PerM
VAEPSRRPPVPEWLLRAGLVAWLWLGVIALAALGVYALSFLSTIVFPLLFAAVAAVLTLPLVDVLQQWRVPRSTGALLGLLLVVGLAGGVIALVGWSIYDQREEIAAAFVVVAQDVQDVLAEQGLAVDGLDDLFSGVSSWLSDGAGGLASNAVNVATSAFSIAIGIFFSLIFLFFLLRDGRDMAAWLRPRLSAATREHVDSAAGAAIVALRGYFAGRSVVAAVDAVLIGAAALVLDVPLVSAIAVLTFVGGFVPYIGAVTAGAVAVVLALAANGLAVALIMLAVILVVQNLIEPLVEARAIGGTLGLHPMIVIIVTTVGGISVGLAGLVLAAPLTSATVRFLRALRDQGEEAAAL